MKNWNQNEVEIIRSKGGVIALADPYDNLVRTGVRPWPPAEIVQKLYRSYQEKAFDEDEKEILQKHNGYYSDLQSIHSEDAITWSVFGTVAHSERSIRKKYVSALFEFLGIKTDSADDNEIFLWRRIPHPDTLVPGGPEIDFGILTPGILLFGEAKWRSSVGKKQGKAKDKDQIQLRVDFLEKYANKLYPGISQFWVLGVGLTDDVAGHYCGQTVKCINATWQDICNLPFHPNRDELIDYLAWKIENTNHK